MTSPDTDTRTATELEITDVRVTPQRDRALLAFATITLNGVFVVHGLKIIEGAKGRFVAMPSRSRRDGNHQDVAHPITREWRGYMEECVLRAYDELAAERDGDEG